MITEVAIQLDGKVWRLPKPKRHHDVIHMLADLGFPTPIRGEQGFWDDERGFLKRDEAHERATELGQVSKTTVPGLLFSEDLW